MERRWTTVLLVFFFFIGLSVLLYPTVSDFINQKHQSRAIASYNEQLLQMKKEEEEAYLAEAEDYNRRLHELPEGGFLYPDRVSGYRDTLDFMGMGIMGYLTIDKIRVELPIYHGISSDVLNVAVGHMEGTSLPVGGESTHCVLSAHRGLPTAKLFTDLDQLEEGDIFTITVLNRVVTYQVDQIRIVLPDDSGQIQIIEGGDYCTLLTCTPYAINTHRLLVRGKRIENIKDKSAIYITADAYKIDTLIAAPAVAAPMLFALLIKLMLPAKKKKKFDISKLDL